MSTTLAYREANTALIEACRQGKEEAFRELYLLYAKAMFNTAMRLLNDRDEAEDVLQDSFIAAFGNLRRYSGKASFGSWLKRIVINHSIDAIKNRLKLDTVSLDHIDAAEEESVEEEEVVYDVEMIRNGIQQLPDGFRIVLTLYLFEGYSHAMIAEQLKISEGTSKSQYHRARKKLVELITPKRIAHER